MMSTGGMHDRTSVPQSTGLCEPANSADLTLLFLERIELNQRTAERRMKLIMATLADIQAALASNAAAEDRIIALVRAQSVQITDLAAKLQDAINNNNPAVMQQIVDQLNADAAEMNAAADAAQQPGSPPAPPVIT